MKRKFSILIISAVIVGLTLSLVGMALIPQVASAEKNQNLDRQVPKPIPATDVKIVKKIPLLPTDGNAKGKPSRPPGQDKKKEEGPAATGVLGQIATGTKYAIVIGICDYPGKKNDICTSDGDSLHMYKALTTLYGYEKANIHLLKDMATTTKGYTTSTVFADVTYELPTHTNIQKAVEDIKSRATSTNDEVVFFFSGHGASGIASDGDKERIDEGIVVWNNATDTENDNNITYIWDGELKSWFGDFGTTRIAFVFDTCRAGGWNDVADSGRVISMATGEDQSAYVYSKEGEDVDGDGTPDGEGVFSHYFVNEGMLQGIADKYDHNGDTTLGEGKDVVVEEAFDYAKASITIPTQKPVISDNFPNDLLL